MDRAGLHQRGGTWAAGRCIAPSRLVNIVLAPVIAFYLTRDVDAIREGSPRGFLRFRAAGYDVISDIDRALAGWVRGQVIVYVRGVGDRDLALLGVPSRLGF